MSFDSRRHTQILYNENRKMLFRAQKNKGKKKLLLEDNVGPGLVQILQPIQDEVDTKDIRQKTVHR
jgi:hypothetical protein